MNKSGKNIRTIIVDDEPIARERIANLLAENISFELIGEYENGVEAREVLIENSIDLMFVDVQMPNMDGISLVKSLEIDQRPLIIFATAFDEFAIDAFNFFAIDYLLKPFSKERFRQTLEKVLLMIKGIPEYSQKNQINGFLSIYQHEENDVLQKSKRISVKLGNRVYFILIEQIEYVIASGNYLEIFADNKLHIIRETMTQLLNRLPTNFLRIHKSSIVNIEFVLELISIGYGNYELKMQNKKMLRVSDPYKQNLLKSLKE